MVLLNGCDIRGSPSAQYGCSSKTVRPGYRQFYGVRGELKPAKLQKLPGKLEYRRLSSNWTENRGQPERQGDPGTNVLQLRQGPPTVIVLVWIIGVFN